MNRSGTFIFRALPRPLRSAFFCALICALLFALAIAWAHPTFLADDYWWLLFPLKNPHFGWTEPYPFSRMPVSTLLVDVFLKLGLWEAAPRVLMTLGFFAHALGFTLLLQTLIERLGKAPNGGESGALFFVLAGLFAFSPDNYEIHLWPVLSIDPIAELLIALALRARSALWAILLATVALLTYDAFFFLLAGACALLLWATWVGDRGRLRDEVVRLGTLAVSAAMLAVGVKSLLGHWLGFLHVVPFERAPGNVLHNFKLIAERLWLVHFYKTNWVSSALLWVAVIGAVVSVVKSRRLGARAALLVLLTPLLVAVPLSFNTYDAPRALFGAQVTQALASAIVFFFFLQSESRPIWRRLGVGAVALSFLIQWAMVLEIKHSNFRALQTETESLRARMAACEAPCLLKVPPPGATLHKDYVLPSFAQPFFLERLRLLYFPDKPIRFEIDGAQ